MRLNSRVIRTASQSAVGPAGVAVVMATFAIVMSSNVREETDVNSKTVQQRAFTVVGIAARTSNAKEGTPEGVIGKQWQRLRKEGLLGEIPNKADGNIVAVYTEYASDKDGEYTYVLGARVTNAKSIPAGMVAKKVPGGRYAVFTSGKGPVQKVVVEMWQRVWTTPKSALGGDRTYKADFEVYDERAQNPADTVVDLYVGVR